MGTHHAHCIIVHEEQLSCFRPIHQFHNIRIDPGPTTLQHVVHVFVTQCLTVEKGFREQARKTRDRTCEQYYFVRLGKRLRKKVNQFTRRGTQLPHETSLPRLKDPYGLSKSTDFRCGDDARCATYVQPHRFCWLKG